jgi:hypothetical protein
MPTLPSVLTRPLLDGTGTTPAPDDGTQQSVQLNLRAGIPAVIALDTRRSLALAVPLGVAGALLAADPLAVVVDTGDTAYQPAPGEQRDPMAPIARLTLIADGAIGDTGAVVAGVPQRLGIGSAAAVEVVVDSLVITAGSLRAMGDYGSQITLRWRDLRTAPATGPPPVTGDPALTRLRPS